MSELQCVLTELEGCIQIDQTNQISASYIYLLAQNLGYSVSINTRDDKEDVYRITLTSKTHRKNPIAIKKFSEIKSLPILQEVLR